MTSWRALGAIFENLDGEEGALGCSWGALGLLLGRSCGALGVSWDTLGTSWVLLGHLGDVLGFLRVLLGCSWSAARDCSGALGTIFENLYGKESALRCSWVPKRQHH